MAEPVDRATASLSRKVKAEDDGYRADIDRERLSPSAAAG